MEKAFVEIVRINVSDIITVSCPEDTLGGIVCDDD